MSVYKPPPPWALEPASKTTSSNAPSATLLDWLELLDEVELLILDEAALLETLELLEILELLETLEMLELEESDELAEAIEDTALEELTEELLLGATAPPQAVTADDNKLTINQRAECVRLGLVFFDLDTDEPLI